MVDISNISYFPPYRDSAMQVTSRSGIWAGICIFKQSPPRAFDANGFQTWFPIIE